MQNRQIIRAALLEASLTGLPANDGSTKPIGRTAPRSI